jgi:hypothetical protein
MNAVSTRSRRFALTLVRHASWVLPAGQSPWAEAMRRELDYIDGDRAAMSWALGCVLAGYRARLAERPRFNGRTAWRQIATSGALMLLIGLALHDNAEGQTEPPRPVFDQTMCDLPGVPPQIGPHEARSVPPALADAQPSRFPPDCAEPSAAKIPNVPRRQ